MNVNHSVTYNHPPSRHSIQIRLNGRIVAAVRGNVLHRSLDASRHFLRQPPAICFDEAVLQQAEAVGAEYVEVKDRETGRIYRASIQAIKDNGFALSRGFGPQLGLSLSQWDFSGVYQPSLFGGE